MHKVRLGSGGYQRQLEKWRREREEAIAVGHPNHSEGLDEHAWMWLQARKPKIVDGKPQFDQPEIKAVAKKMYELDELQSKESSKPRGTRMCSVQPLVQKSMEAASEACPLSLPSRMGSSRTGIAIRSMAARRNNCKKRQRKP
jgi:hypothetical protein